MYFSISPQSVALPGGPTLDFRVNPDDTSKVEIHLAGEDARGNQGTHILTFNRNGGPVIDQFVPSNPKPLAGFASVNDDPVRMAPEPTPLKSQFDKDAEAGAAAVKARQDKVVSTKTLDAPTPPQKLPGEPVTGRVIDGSTMP